MDSRPSQTRTHAVLNRFILIQCLLFLLPLLSAYIHPILLGNVRNSQILLVLLFLLFMARQGTRLQDLLSWRCPTRLWRVFALISLLSLLGTGFTHYLGLKLNGEDFSIFDWMLFNTNHRTFMTSPICNMAGPLGVCHHFAIHPTYIMLPLALLHRILPGPLLLVSIHSLALWAALMPLKALGHRFLKHDVLIFAVLLAYLGNGYVGAILNHGFHVEVFYIPFGLGFLRAWVEGRRSFWFWLLLFLSVKEDAAFYTLAFAFWLLRDRRSVFVILASLSVLALNLLFVQPHFLQQSAAAAPSYLRFWGHLGSNKIEILEHILTHPFQTLFLVLRSHWYLLFGSLLFIPLLSPTALAAMAPALLIYGLSNISHMREYATYYSAPLIPFLFYGLIKGGQRVLALPWKKSPLFFLFACLLFCLTGGGYQKFPPIAFRVLHDLAEARSFLDQRQEGLVCAQTLLYPHLPYEWRIQPLSAECMAQPEAWTVLLNNTHYDSYPLGSKELIELAQNVPHTRLVRSYPSGLQIYRREPL